MGVLAFRYFFVVPSSSTSEAPSWVGQMRRRLPKRLPRTFLERAEPVIPEIADISRAIRVRGGPNDDIFTNAWVEGGKEAHKLEAESGHGE